MKDIKIKTPYGDKNWLFVKRVFDTHQELLDLAKWVQTSLKVDERLEFVNALIAKAEHRSDVSPLDGGK